MNACKHCFSGAVLFNLHALDLKVELQNLLFEVAKEDLVLWKQMRCIEITAALIAETLIELGVSIVTQPDEVHWPNGVVSKAPEPAKKKKGGKKSENKNKHGIFGQLVSDLAPKLPKLKKNSTDKGSDEPEEGASASQSSSKSKKSSEKLKANGVKSRKEQEEADFQGQLEGLPVQGCKCKL